MRKEFPSIERLREQTASLAEGYRRDRAGLQNQVTYEHGRREKAESKLIGVLRSRSWRITEFLRRLASWFRRDLGGRWDSLDKKHVIDKSVFSPPPDVVRAEDEIYRTLDQIPKDLLTDWAEVQLETFLSSGAALSFTEPDRPRISVLLVLFNRVELTLACLRSLLAEKDPSCEVVIVDNASTDSTSRLLSRVQGATILENTENIHFLRGINQAAKAARGKHLLILNNDTELLPGTLLAALNALESASDIGAVGGKLILPDGHLQEAGSIIWNDGSCLGYGRGLDPLDPVTMFRREVDYCSGAFLLTPKAIFDRMEGFDTRYEPAYYEETDYCMRLWEADLRVIYEPSAVILHHEFASSKSMTDATDLHRVHQEIFVRAHKENLKQHFAPDTSVTLEARFASQRKQKKTLFVDDQIPYSATGPGFPRSGGILRAIVKQGHAVTFFPTDSNKRWEEIYRHIPGEVEVMSDTGPGRLESLLEARRGYYDAILVSRPHNMKYLGVIIQNHPDLFDGVSIVYDAEALFSIRELGGREISGEVIKPEDRERIIQDEVQLAAPADVVITVSEREGKVFTQHGIERVEILGHTLHPTPSGAGFEERKGLLFVGAVYEETSPNGDSLLWFLDKVLPSVREALGSDIPFTIAGVNRSSRIRARAFEGVNIVGAVDDLTALYARHRVFVAPTRFGAGIPHKVHEAAAHGLPVIATGLLAAQLGWEDRVQLSVADEAEEFAVRLIELYRNASLWESIRLAALRQVEIDCSPERFDEKLNSIFADGARATDIVQPAKPLAAR